MDTEELKSNITSGEHWLRLVYMLLFAVLLYVAGMVMGVVIVLQFLFALLTGGNNDNLRHFGQVLSLYIYDCLNFLTYNTEQKPFPFDDWPDASRVTEARKKRPARSRAKTTAKKAPSAKKTGSQSATDSDS